ncbi:hypothetical protein N9A51_01335, partial [Pseudomonadales bacterium]|nr:hypothetical protein [Pseudomonadales bacterium]
DADGWEYVGEWRDDNRHGQGTYIDADGSKYVGEWRDDNRHGQGTYFYADGNSEELIYKNGEIQLGLNGKTNVVDNASLSSLDTGLDDVASVSVDAADIKFALKMVAAMAKAQLHEKDYTKFIETLTEPVYFVCEGKGSTIAKADDVSGKQMEKKSVYRVNFVVVLSDEPYSFGALALSNPSHENGLLVASVKLAEANNWYEIWDSAYSSEPTPLDNLVKGKVSKFFIDIELSKNNPLTDMQSGSLSDDGYIYESSRVANWQINRITNNFVYQERITQEVVLDALTRKIYLSNDVEGVCIRSDG